MDGYSESIIDSVMRSPEYVYGDIAIPIEVVVLLKDVSGNQFICPISDNATTTLRALDNSYTGVELNPDRSFGEIDLRTNGLLSAIETFNKVNKEHLITSYWVF